jgi:phage gp37-like protein
MYTITQIENAILSRLEAALSGVRTFGTLADFLAAKLDDIEAAALIMPAVYVVFDSSEYHYPLRAVQDRLMAFDVLVVVRNLRGDEAVRQGDGSAVGAYDLLESIRAALTGQQLALSIDSLIPTRERSVAGTEHLAVYSISFETRVREAVTLRHG